MLLSGGLSFFRRVTSKEVKAKATVINDSLVAVESTHTPVIIASKLATMSDKEICEFLHRFSAFQVC
jgi:hypothetical protein